MGLTYDDYQAGALSTALYGKNIDDMAIEELRANLKLAYAIIGLAGEVGEVCNKIKKVFRGDKILTPELKSELAKEIGGCEWYMAATATELNLNRGSIAQQNLDILASRKERGVLKGDGDNR